MPKPNRKRGGAVLREELSARRAEARLRAAEARFKVAGIRAADRARKEMLATYSAAGRGRNNKDWRPAAVSADMAIIPDASTMNARTRQMARDSWVVKSAIAAYRRNVVGCGVIPIPQARDGKGNLLVDVNRSAMMLFWEWAGDKRWCDSEEDQTFWQMQSLAESERPTVGEAFWVLSYQPNRLPNGKIDRSRPVGLKIQAFEPEQLDETIQSYSGPETGGIANEVRGGLELDALGRTIAYHVFARNPNDYAWKQSLRSVRIPGERVLHYFRKERVRQKRGVTDLAAVLQDARDISRHKEANLWRAIMEACIGLTVKRESQNTGGILGGIQPRMTGDSGTTASGMPTADFVPGMIADPGQGVTLEPFLPQAPGNSYEPFQRQTLRGIAAGANLSYGQLSRDFTQGTYSGQRQEMLEDRKEFEPLQELHAHNLLFPVYRMFFALCVMEGRLDVPDFETAPNRYTAAEYVAPPPTWIDPEKEANAIEKMIDLKLMTREEAAHFKGMRLIDILDKIAAEAGEAKSRGITFPENVDTEVKLADATQKRADAQAKLNPPPVAGPDPELERKKAQADIYGVAVRAGGITPQLEDEVGFRTENGLPPLSEAAKEAWEKDGNVRRPITITAPDGSKPAPGGGGVPSDQSRDDAGATKAGLRARTLLLEVAQRADVPPGLRPAENHARRCGNCVNFDATGSKCKLYPVNVSPDEDCNDFQAAEFERRVISTPPVPEGERPMDDPRSGYLDRGERGVQ